MSPSSMLSPAIELNQGLSRAHTGSPWDEVWDGVLRMAPMPNRDHQRLARDLLIFLQQNWAIPNGGEVHQEVNLTTPTDEKRWTENFRIPDLVLLSKDRFSIDKNEYMVGPPLVCIEICSPGDFSREKLPFYASLGVPEVWIIDRDTRQPEIHVLTGSAYQQQTSDSTGRLTSTVIELRLGVDQGKLTVWYQNQAEPALLPIR